MQAHSHRIHVMVRVIPCSAPQRHPVGTPRESPLVNLHRRCCPGQGATKFSNQRASPFPAVAALVRGDNGRKPWRVLAKVLENAKQCRRVEPPWASSLLLRMQSKRAGVDIVACVFDYLLEAQQSFNTQDLKVVVALFDRATRRSAKKKSPAAGGENAGQGVTPAPAAENGEGTSEPCTKLVRQAELAGWQ